MRLLLVDQLTIIEFTHSKGSSQAIGSTLCSEYFSANAIYMHRVLLFSAPTIQVMRHAPRSLYCIRCLVTLARLSPLLHNDTTALELAHVPQNRAFITKLL